MSERPFLTDKTLEGLSGEARTVFEEVLASEWYTRVQQGVQRNISNGGTLENVRQIFCGDLFEQFAYAYLKGRINDDEGLHSPSEVSAEAFKCGTVKRCTQDISGDWRPQVGIPDGIIVNRSDQSLICGAAEYKIQYRALNPRTFTQTNSLLRGDYLRFLPEYNLANGYRVVIVTSKYINVSEAGRFRSAALQKGVEVIMTPFDNQQYGKVCGELLQQIISQQK